MIMAEYQLSYTASEINQKLGMVDTLSANKLDASELDSAIDAALEEAKADLKNVNWDDIADKPFTTVGGDTLTWDGNTEGLVSCVDSISGFYKVSDATPTIEEIGNEFVTTWNDGYVENPGREFIEVASGVFRDIDSAAVCVVHESGVGADMGWDMTFPEPGIYFIKEGEFYVSSFCAPGYDGFHKQSKLNIAALPDEAFPDVEDVVFVYTGENTTTADGKACNGGYCTKTYEELVQLIIDGKLLRGWLYKQGCQTGYVGGYSHTLLHRYEWDEGGYIFFRFDGTASAGKFHPDGSLDVYERP